MIADQLADLFARGVRILVIVPATRRLAIPGSNQQVVKTGPSGEKRLLEVFPVDLSVGVDKDGPVAAVHQPGMAMFADPDGKDMPARQFIEVQDTGDNAAKLTPRAVNPFGNDQLLDPAMPPPLK